MLSTIAIGMTNEALLEIQSVSDITSVTAAMKDVYEPLHGMPFDAKAANGGSDGTRTRNIQIDSLAL